VLWLNAVMKQRTRVNHPPSAEVAADNPPLVAPIYQSVKFEFESVAETGRAQRGERPGYHYSRVANPTTRALELLVAELQGRPEALAVGSGMAATAATLFALLKAGEHILCFAETYAPTRRMIRQLLGRYGVAHTMLSIEDRPGIERVLAERPTRLVWFETPTNPVLRIADIEHLTTLAQRHGVLTVLDNTFAGFHQHGQYPVDLYVHSLTKYAAGHGDVMGGAVIGERGLIERIRRDAGLLGPVLDPHAAFLVSRGLRTYFLRREAQCASAVRIAEWLSSALGVARVLYPGLASHPGHALATRQMSDFGSIVLVEFASGAAEAAAFTDALQLFACAASLGSTESLAQPAVFMGGAELSAQERTWSGLTPGMVRLSIGIEDAEDLIADLDQALGPRTAA
jgi:cystathionine beta-lyase/cystathionine gamma-synthase